MEDRETARMRKYVESKTIRIMMATVPHVTSVLGLRKISGRWIFVDTSVLIQQLAIRYPSVDTVTSLPARRLRHRGSILGSG